MWDEAAGKKEHKGFEVVLCVARSWTLILVDLFQLGLFYDTMIVFGWKQHVP